MEALFMANKFFTFDDRLGIPIPMLENEWEHYSSHIQQCILLTWESIRGKIPDRIKEIEHLIENLQQQLYEETDFERSCQLNYEISKNASIINDLWIWYRSSESIRMDKSHV